MVTEPARADERTSVRIAGGTFRMGSDRFFPEEGPPRLVTVDSFWIDRYPVTNRALTDFIDATRHVTVAERPLDPRSYPTPTQSSSSPAVSCSTERPGQPTSAAPRAGGHTPPARTGVTHPVPRPTSSVSTIFPSCTSPTAGRRPANPKRFDTSTCHIGFRYVQHESAPQSNTRSVTDSYDTPR